MQPLNPPKIIPVPEPVPLAESDNPDVIALRSALMILQMQRETAKKDILALQNLKNEALKDPEGYVRELLQRTRLEQERASRGHPTQGESLLAPTLRYLVEGLGNDAEILSAKSGLSPATTKDKGQGNEDAESDEDAETAGFNHAPPPKPQNVYRMPPVNWAKYHVAGSSLDKLHEDQRARPSPGQPTFPGAADMRSEPYIMAAPYEPVTDAARLGASEHPMQTRRGIKK